MRRFIQVFLCIGVLTASSAPFAQAQTGPAPDAIVRSIYSAYDGYGLGTSPTDPDMRNFYSDRLKSLLAEEDARIRRDGLGKLDFDVFVDDRDSDVTDIAIGAPQIDGDKAVVAVQLRNFGEPRQFRFLFVNEGDAWRIDDIVAVRTTDPWQLTALLTGN